jgi:hypothetical protein
MHERIRARAIGVWLALSSTDGTVGVGQRFARHGKRAFEMKGKFHSTPPRPEQILRIR